MFPRSSTPPTGPRGSSPARRGMNRGGVQKRRAGPTRVDRDGDLMMDSAGGQGHSETDKFHLDGNKLSRGRAAGRMGHNASTSRNNFTSKQTEQAIIRGLESQQVNVLQSRINRGLFSEHGGPGARGGRRHFDRPTTHLRVRGLKDSKAASNPDGGVKDLLNFLERKANGIETEHHKEVRIQKSYMERDDLVISASPDDLARILKLNGFKFAGTSLTVEFHEPKSSGPPVKEGADLSREAKETQERIKNILSTRYDMDLKLLNLSGLGRDPGLVEMGMFDAKNRISKLFPVLMVVCDRLFSSAQEKRNAIISVTLADNELDSIANITTLAQTFPDLQNLDLSRNKIMDLRALEGWRWKFRKLQNLKMTDNPIEATMPDYGPEIVKWFPTLQILNDVQVRTSAEAATVVVATAQAHGNNRVSPIPISGPDFRDVNQIGEEFLKQFFELYDRDRATLANNFYDGQSAHSISINVSAPRSEHHSSSPPFSSAAFKHSRNLVKLKALPGQMARMFRGVEAIKLIWAELPLTEHPDLTAHVDKYLVDCHPISGLRDPDMETSPGVDGLILMVHGEFEEQDGPIRPKIPRSFSRTFVLGPGSSSGPLIRVVSDLLVLRAWGPLASVSSGQDSSMVVAKSETQPRQEDFIKQLVNRTNMTSEYASMCLAETGWDLEQAFIAFDANKSKLPADAFITQPVGL